MAHWRTTQKDTNKNDQCYHDNYIRAHVTRINQQLLLGIKDSGMQTYRKQTAIYIIRYNFEWYSVTIIRFDKNMDKYSQILDFKNMDKF